VFIVSRKQEVVYTKRMTGKLVDLRGNPNFIIILPKVPKRDEHNAENIKF
jgi:hypothetical protein